MNDFYVILPSHSSSFTNNKNTASDFEVKLEVPLELNGSWEVGLTSISLPECILQVKFKLYLWNYFINVSSYQVFKKFENLLPLSKMTFHPLNRIASHDQLRKGIINKISIPVNKESLVQSIIDVFDFSFLNTIDFKVSNILKDKVKVKVDESGNLCIVIKPLHSIVSRVTNGYEHMTVHLLPDLTDSDTSYFFSMFGANNFNLWNNRIDEIKFVIKDKEFDNDPSSIEVICDIVDYSLSGDKQKKILRTFRRTITSESELINYAEIQYRRICKTIVRTIGVKLEHDDGRLLYLPGKSQLTLHLRKV